MDIHYNERIVLCNIRNDVFICKLLTGSTGFVMGSQVSYCLYIVNDIMFCQIIGAVFCSYVVDGLVDLLVNFMLSWVNSQNNADGFIGRRISGLYLVDSTVYIASNFSNIINIVWVIVIIYLTDNKR